VSQDRRFYIVRGRAKHGLITHRCPTIEFALQSLERFTREGFADICILDPDGAPLTPTKLKALGEKAATKRPSQVGAT
jgi:hypothetical protein